MKTNLYIFNSKDNNKIQDILIFIIVFFLICFLLGKIFEFMHIKNIGTDFDSKMRWNEFYGLKKNSIDIIFLGSSHACRSFDPELFDTKTNLTSFNLGSSAQMPDTGYYAIKEALNYQEPKLLIYDLYWGILERDHNIVQAKHNYEFMRNSQNKKEFFQTVFNTRDKIEYSLKVIRYRKDVSAFFDNLITAQIKSLLNMDLSQESNEYYKGNGFIFCDEIVSKSELIEDNQFENYKFIGLNNVQMSYIVKTLELCKEQGVKVIFVTAPVPPESIQMIANYKNIHNSLNSFSMKHGIPYLDYNYINENNPFLFSRDFKDDNHLNYFGVKKFNEKLCNDIIWSQFNLGAVPAHNYKDNGK